MIDIKCANCKNEISVLTDAEFQKVIDRSQPERVGARYVYDLWHYKIEDCPICNYANFDVSKINEKEAEYVNSDKFLDMINNEYVENMDVQDYEEFNMYMAFSLLKEFEEEYFYASTSCFKAFETLIVGVMNYRDENIDYSNLENMPQEYLDTEKYLNDLTHFLLKKSFKLINLAIEKNQNKIDNYIFKAYLEFQLDKKEDSLKTTNFLLSQFILNENQKQAAEMLLRISSK